MLFLYHFAFILQIKSPAEKEKKKKKDRPKTLPALIIFKLFKIIFNWLFWCNIDESINSIVMLLNCTFICCYIKSMFDYIFGMQKAPISWNDPCIIYCCLEEVPFSKFVFAHSFR